MGNTYYVPLMFILTKNFEVDHRFCPVAFVCFILVLICFLAIHYLNILLFWKPHY